MNQNSFLTGAEDENLPSGELYENFRVRALVGSVKNDDSSIDAGVSSELREDGELLSVDGSEDQFKKEEESGEINICKQ